MSDRQNNAPGDLFGWHPRPGDDVDEAPVPSITPAAEDLDPGGVVVDPEGDAPGADQARGGDFDLFGVDLFGEPIRQAPRGVLSSRFVMPPFSVLNAREGAWQERKRAWISRGIRSEVGRDARAFNTREWAQQKNVATCETDTSIFDPVLTELAYRWFCPPGGTILDPFAGGSVRGIVAACLGRPYYGIDLRPEQVDANEVQAEDIIGATSAATPRPTWVCGDSLVELPNAPLADFVFSCPPYGDLEVYSDDPNDLSTMDKHAFAACMKRIVLRCYGRLRPDRFACFVIGEYRDKRTGGYVGFVPQTIRAFEEAGFQYYNEIVLVTSCGSLPVRASKQFYASRKIGKTHQNVLVFVKGDPKAAAAACHDPDEKRW